MLERVGRYEVKAELGRGGFGRVYRAWDPTVGRMVAIKTLTAGGDPELLQRFRNEAAAAGKLRHRNIIIIHDFGEQDGEPYIVMELLDGEDLQRVMYNQRPLTLLQRMQIMEQVAEGLDHAHRNGVVHRDVKPANMMVLPDRSVKIMDFGIALVTQVAGSRLTKTGTIPGTLKYMAPEQFRGATNDPLSDIFAYGVTYYELLSGVHPFDGPSQPAIMYNILSGEPRPLSEILPGCPDGLSEVIMRCLHKERESRYSSLDDLQFDLKPILAELKHEHARGLFAEAERLVQAQQFETAQALIRESLELNPADRGARRLRERIQQEMQRQASAPKLEALLNTGRHLLASRKFEDAINTFESALKLDKASQEVHNLLQQAQAVRQQSAEAERLLREAKNALGNQDLTGAYQRINEALQRDPSHPDAARLVARVREEIASRERDRKRREEISQARGALLLGSFDEALALLERIEQTYPESPELPQLVAEARAAKEAHQRQQRLQSGLSESKTLLRDRHLPTAVHRLETLVQEFPSSAEVNELLEYARNELRAKKRQETIERLMREVHAFEQNHQYDAAIQMLEKGLGYFPGDLTIDRQLEETRAAKAAHQRKSALDEALAQARQWRRDGQHEAAIRVLDAFRASYGEEPAVQSLRAETEREWEDKKRNESIQTLLAEIERLIARNDAATALKVADQAVAKYAGVPELEVARARLEKLLQQQKRQQAISKLVSEVTELTSTHRFDRALELIDRGMMSYPDDSALQRARDTAVQARTAQERKEAIEAALAQSKAMLDRNQPERAAAICDDLLRRYSDAGEVAAVAAKAREQLRRIEEQRLAIAAVTAEASSLAAAARFDEAIGTMERAVREFGELSALTGPLKDIRDRKRTAERERGLTAAIEECDGLRIQQDWEAARRVLDEAARKFGDDVRIRERRQRVQLEWDAAKKQRAEESRQRAEAERKQREEEQRQLEAKRRAEEEARQRAEAERKQREEEQRQLEAKRRAEEEARQRAEAERKQREEEQRQIEAKRRADEEARQRAEAERKQREEEQRQIEAKRRADEEARQRAEAERKQREEEQRQLEAKRRAEEEARQRAEAERKQREEEQRQLEAKRRAEEEARRRAEEAERKQREEEQRQLEAKRRAEEEARQRAEEAERKRQAEELKKQEAERKKQAAERTSAIAKLAQKTERELSQGRFDQALSIVDQALQSYPGEAVFLTLRDRAKSGAEKKRQEEAKKQERAAVEQPKPAPVPKPAPAPVTEPAPPPPPPNRRWIGIAAAVVLTAAGGIYMATRPDTGGTDVVVTPTPTPSPSPTPRPTAAPTPPPPTPTPPPPTVAQGTIAVSAGVPNADVFLDGKRVGATDASGNFRAPVEAKRYAVRVDKPGFQGGTEQSITVPKDGRQQVNFTLTVMEATLALRGATPGAQVKIDSRPAGTVGADGSFNSRITPGEHSIEISKDQFQARTIRRGFDPGQTVTLDRNEVNLVAIPKVDPQAAVAQEWEKLKNSRDIAQLEDFARRHRGNPLVRNAEERVVELRWDAVDKKNIAALRDYGSKNPNSPHARTAADMIARLEWDALDKNNLKALQEYRQRHPQGENAARATKEIERLEQKAAAEKKQAEDRAKADSLKGDRDAIQQALAKFTAAIGRKDTAGMSAVFPGSDREWKDTFSNKNFVVTMTLTPVGDPEISGDTAAVTCDRVTKTIDRGKDLGGRSQRIRVTLAKRGGNWIIQGMK